MFFVSTEHNAQCACFPQACTLSIMLNVHAWGKQSPFPGISRMFTAMVSCRKLWLPGILNFINVARIFEKSKSFLFALSLYKPLFNWTRRDFLLPWLEWASFQPFTSTVTVSPRPVPCPPTVGRRTSVFESGSCESGGHAYKGTKPW